MLPDFVVDDKANQLFTNAVIDCQSFLKCSCSPLLTYFLYFKFSQFSTPTDTTTRNGFRSCSHPMVIPTRESAFFFCVVVVAIVITFKQVLRIATRWIIAMMQYQLCGPISVSQEKGDSGRFHVPPCSISETNSKVPVTTQIAFLLPFPTVSIWPLAESFVDMTPKTQNVFLAERWWYRIDFRHIVKIILSDVLGLWGVNSVPQAVL